MGAAKNRGTFEERKVKAIEEGRIKTPTKSVNRIMREFQDDLLTGDPLVDFINIASGRLKR